MKVLNYSLDNLSMMALILSIGFVVDDAIVMLENIVRHIEAGETPLDAALKGSKEIGFTILSMTDVAGGRVHSDSVHGRHCSADCSGNSRSRLRPPFSFPASSP